MIYILIVSIVFVLYIWQQNVRYSQRYDTYFSNYPRTACLQWCKSDQPFQINTRITTKLLDNTDRVSFNADGVMVYAQTAEVVNLGDHVSLSGNLEKRVTDNKNVQYRLINPTIAVNQRVSDIRGISGFKLQSILSRVTDSILNRLHEVIDYPYAGLLAGILFGIRTYIDPDFYNALINTGTVHIIAASGYNVSLLTAFSLSFWLRIMSRSVALFITFAGIAAYVVMAGASEPLLRAGIMGSLYLVAQIKGREYGGLWALGVTVIVMLALKPTIVQSISFLLSVSSTFGILVLAPHLKRKLIKGTSFLVWVKAPTWLKHIGRAISTDLATTLAAIIATLPIILITFDSFNLISIVANMAVLWTIAPMMILSALALLVDWVSAGLSHLVGWLIYPYAWYFVKMIEVCNASTRLKMSDLHLSWWFGFGYYLIILAFILKGIKKADT
ncbi:hypothetical protein A3B57_00640 [Microgenomates group bacterium RIFCSPLOWO2_01_FULL_47_10]|nr:MAG: hypothetical protein A3B57_00640 [Microgenomates group bacterium RIFCSPLOWO2_01_FULL_47_10]